MLSKTGIEYIKKGIYSAVNMDQLSNMDNWILRLYNRMSNTDFFRLLSIIKVRKRSISMFDDEKGE